MNVKPTKTNLGDHCFLCTSFCLHSIVKDSPLLKIIGRSSNKNLLRKTWQTERRY
jgi:hypothetical protein